MIGQRPRALLLVPALALVAGCGAASVTPQPSTPTVTLPPAESPAASRPPLVSSHAPPPSPSGPVAPVVVDPWSEAAVIASLLRPSDVPADLVPKPMRIQSTTETPGWVEYAGLRLVAREWGGRGAVSSLFDFRYQFPSAMAAQGFLDAARTALSEEGAGLVHVEGPLLGDASFRYAGTISFGGIQTNNYNYLVRVQNIVAKVFLGGGADLDPLTADSVADRIPERLRSALKGGLAPGPSGSGAFPNEAEATLLRHIPENLRAGCERVEDLYPEELDSVRCRPFNGPSIDYTAFGNSLDMTEAFQGDLDSADPAPTENGQCALGNYASTYNVNGEPAGRIMCTTFLSPGTQLTHRVIEWTNDDLKILAYASSASLSWGDMVEFWRGSAGPIP